MKVLSAIVHRPSPGNGRGAWKSIVAYRDGSTSRLIESYSDTSGRDRYDDHVERFSEDGGKTWNRPRLVIPSKVIGENVVVRGIETFLDSDAKTQRVFRGYNEATFHNDDRDESVEDSHSHSTLCLQYSLDGGETFESPIDLTVITKNSEIFQSRDPRVGLNPVVSCTHMQTLEDGTLVIPIMRWAGSNTGDPQAVADSGYPIVSASMAIGNWNADKSDLNWTFGRPLSRLPDRQTPGFAEVSIAPWENGDLLAVARMEPHDPEVDYACKWWAISSDQGRTWTPARPLRDTRGGWVHSPATCSRIIRHSSGKLLLITNLYDHPCQGLGPRYALHIAEIGRDAHGDPAIMRDSISTIDQRRPGELDELALSNFTVYEDRVTRELCVFCPRVYARRFTLEDSDCMLYRLLV
jgi:hypothetical protein